MITIYEKATGICRGTFLTYGETDVYGVTDKVCTGNFIVQCFDSVTELYYEGATIEEVIATNTPKYEKKIIECVKWLRDRALVSSISKEKDIEYLRGQAEVYKSKYNVAKQYCIDQTINDTDWYNAIVVEMNNTNTELGLVGTENELNIALFMGFIKNAFETGLTRSKKFEPSIEIFRCKAKDLYVSGQFTRCDQMINYAYSIPLQMDLSDVDGFLNDIDLI